MKVIKPLRLGVLHRTFENDGKCVFVPTIFLCFPFEAPSLALQETHMWKLIAQELGENTAIDECMPKPQGEVLVSGKAYPSGGKAQPGCSVRVQMLGIDKQLYVVGDREWRNGVATAPEPFTEMPIGWSRAFGGEGFKANPDGRGAVVIKDEETGVERKPLPNVENPKRLIKAEGDKPKPAGFGSIPLHWPQRLKKAGTYNDRWLKERYPGFPEDLDWHFFNTALPDQWIDGHFTGDESFTVENMHAEEPTLTAHLPGMQTRCFITLDDENGEEEFREIPMKIDTVHLLPNRMRGIVVFRGMTEVKQDDAADVKQLIIAAERPGEPRPVSHYKDVLAVRMDKQKAALASLRDGDLMPPRDPDAPQVEGESLGETEQLVKTDGLLAANQRRKSETMLQEAREQLIANDIDPDEHLPEEMPVPEQPPDDPEQFADYVEEKLALAEKMKVEADQKVEEALAKAREECAKHDLDYDALVEEVKTDVSGPPKFNAEEEFEKIVDQLELGRNAGMPFEDAEAKIRDPDLMQNLQKTEAKFKETYRKFAQFFPAAQSLGEEEAARVRAEVEQKLKAGESLAECDLTGADLNGIDFSGVNLEGVFAEAANLSGANFSHANLTDAVLTRADLTETRFPNATVAGTNFGAAKLHGTDLSGGLDLTGAVFTQATLVDANLSGAKLDGADFLDASFENCDLSGVEGDQLNFISSEQETGLSMTGVKLSACQLTRCNFLFTDLRNSDLSGANFRGSVFLGAKLDGVDFGSSDCSELRVVYGSVLAGANFRGAKLEKANLRGIDLQGCDFSGAEMAGADLSESNLEGAKLYRINAPGVLIMKANLKNADLTAANLMEGIMQKSNIKGACFKGANLFRVDFAKIDGNVGTNFDGANMKFIRFVERRNG